MATGDSPSSELDVDESILKRVKKAFSSVAAAQRDSDFVVDDDLGFILEGDEGASRRLTETLQKRFDELQHQKEVLEAEVRQMEEQIVKQEADPVLDEELESAILSLAGAKMGNDGDVDQSDLLSRLVESAKDQEGDEEMEKLKSHIKLNEAFSGIKFKSTDWEVKYTDDSGLLREHTHIGTALGYDFKVVFVTREDKVEKGDGEKEEVARILELTVEVDPRAKQDMESFLAMVSMDFDLMAFYQTYVKYCLHHKERADTLEVAKSKFGDIVHLTQGSTGYRLRFSNDKGMKLVFTWDVAVSVQGTVEHCINVQVKLPSNSSEDVIDTLSRVPQLLDNMVFAYGHREGFLHLLTLFTPPVET